MFELFHTFKLFIALSCVLFTRHRHVFHSIYFSTNLLLAANKVSVFFVILFTFLPKKLASSAYSKQLLFLSIKFLFILVFFGVPSGIVSRVEK